MTSDSQYKSWSWTRAALTCEEQTITYFWITTPSAFSLLHLLSYQTNPDKVSDYVMINIISRLPNISRPSLVNGYDIWSYTLTNWVLLKRDTVSISQTKCYNIKLISLKLLAPNDNLRKLQNNNWKEYGPAKQKL